MHTSKTYTRIRTCIVCEQRLFGRSDKVFCDITCKNHYHSEARKSAKTVSSETVTVLRRNWAILTSLMGETNDNLVINKLALSRHGFDFDTVTSVRTDGLQLKFGVFEFTWSFGKHEKVSVSLDRKQERISPFLFKRWKYLYGPEPAVNLQSSD